MITLKFVNKNGNEYTLLDENNNQSYKLFFEFYGVKFPNINDYISFDEDLLDIRYEGFAQPYAFEKITEQDKYEKRYDKDYAILTLHGKKIGLKRIYG